MKKLIMLGTGNAMVTKIFNTCFLIELPDGELFMTDAGGGNGSLRRPGPGNDVDFIDKQNR